MFGQIQTKYCLLSCLWLVIFIPPLLSSPSSDLPIYIYIYTVIPTQNPEESKTYTGMTSTEFKDRFRNHNKSFNHLRYSKETTLSLHVWSLQNLNIDYDIQWKVIDRANPFSPVTGVCVQPVHTWKILYYFQTWRGPVKQKWRNLQALHSQKTPSIKQQLTFF